MFLHRSRQTHGAHTHRKGHQRLTASPGCAILWVQTLIETENKRHGNTLKTITESFAPAIGRGAYFESEPVAAYRCRDLLSDDGREGRAALMRGIWDYYNDTTDGARDEASVAIVNSTIAIREHVRVLVFAKAVAQVVAA